MITLFLPVLYIVIGFALLIWSADKFVLGASNTARSFSISPLIVGVVIVGLGTSAPEMLVSAIASLQGKTDLAIGNAIGSNITNIGLVIGFVAIIYPMHIHSKLLKREMPFLLTITVGTICLLWDLRLSFIDGLILVSLMFTMLAYTVYETKNSSGDTLPQEILDEMPEEISKGEALKWLLFGAIVLVASSRLLVLGAVEVAQYYNVSDHVIGLTIVAIGTSLPELAATLAAARQKQFDLAVGNIIGSNIFNLLGVLGVAGLIGPTNFEAIVISQDSLVMFGLTVALIVFSIAWGKGKKAIICRLEGAILLLSYLSYMGWLLYKNVLV
ncbi:calcium/sodium antiporter [Psychromonas sp. PT13]|uniref:calcium/sodium antiporter n=1 Tax=Psychromonas sp. PT13 TaxID=3439547 RepID=UPI003EBCF355